MQNLLKTLCLSSTNEVFDILGRYNFSTIYPQKKRRYAFRPGRTATSPLVVCHADTVVLGGFGPHNFNVKGDLVNSIALDDRLGIAAMLALIDVKSPMADCAMLVCDEEEIGRSTASLFDEPITPNWMVELDRRGTDVVCYEYDSPILRSLLQHVGYEVGQGSFSDICYLEHLYVCGFNMGVGYHREHSTECFADLRDTVSQMGKLEKFYAKFHDVRLDFEPMTYRPSTSSAAYDDFEDAWDEYLNEIDDRDLTDDWAGPHHRRI